jgi:integrase
MPRAKSQSRNSSAGKTELWDQIAVQKKTQTYPVKETGGESSYTFWIASWEVPKDRLPLGAKRKRITASGARQEVAKANLVVKVTEFLDKPEKHWQKTKSRGMTLDTYFKGWAERILRYEDISETMKRRTVENYRHHVSPYIGKKPIHQIDASSLLALLNSTLRQKRVVTSRINKSGRREINGLSPSTRKNIYSLLKKLFRWITKEGLISQNPMDDVKPPKIDTPKENIDHLIKKIPQLMEDLRIENNPDYCRFLLQCLGLRRSERLGLTWDDLELDIDEPVIVINHQLARHETPDFEYDLRRDEDVDKQGWYLKPTKTQKGRDIPLTPMFASALKQYRKQWLKNKKKWDAEREQQLKAYEIWEASDHVGDEPVVLPPIGFENHVFLKPNGELITPNKDNDDWNNLLKQKKLPKFRGHLMRHATASMLADSNFDVSELILKNLLGHDTTAMTYYYTRVHQKNVRLAMGKYEKKMSIFDTKR